MHAFEDLHSQGSKNACLARQVSTAAGGQGGRGADLGLGELIQQVLLLPALHRHLLLQLSNALLGPCQLLPPSS